MSLALMVLTAVLSTYVTLGRNFTRSLGVSSANQPTLATQARNTLGAFAQDVRMASGISGTPYNYSVTLALPTVTSTNEATYYYNGTASPVVVSIHGTNVTMPANSLVRAFYNGTTVTSRTLHSNLIATYGCFIRYYDTSGNPYDSGSSPYTTVTSYSPGIKQLSLSFSSQAGSATNGTLTQVYQTDSQRLILRNKALLQ